MATKSLAEKTLYKRTPFGFSGGLITPPPADYLAQFYDTRRGYGQIVDAGFGSGWTVLTVTNTADSGAGSFRAALATTGKTIVRFQAGLGDIVDPNRSGWDCTDNTLLDGYGYTGTLYGHVNSANCDNFVAMFVSCTQPFAYLGSNGKPADPSGGVFTASNCPRAYFYRCTGWDTGDIIFASGAYQLTPNRTGDKPPPYYATVDQCRFGPNPGVYAIMAPIRGTYVGTYFPGSLNPFDNDARNGKCMNDAYDHTWVDAHPADFADFDHASFVTMINNVMQGCHIRNGKARSEYADVVNNIVAKYGTPYDLGLTAVTTGGAKGNGDTGKISLHHGAGCGCDDNATMNIEGEVFIPYVNGEQIVGFQDVVADPLIAANPSYGMHRIRVGFLPNGSHDPDGGATANTAIKMEGKAATQGNARIAGCYLVGQTTDTPAQTTGFARPAYGVTVTDVSTYAAAKALVAQLEDNPTTRAGNPWSTTQPPNWRDVHTGSTFPVGG